MNLDPSPNPGHEALRCHACGAELDPGAQSCPLCGAPRPAVSSEPAPPTPLPPPTEGLNTYSLESLLLLITLAAVLCGVTALAPGVGIFLMIALAPVAIHATWIGHQLRQHGTTLTLPNKLSLLASSLLFLGTVSIAAGIAFVAVCYPTGFGVLFLMSSVTSIGLDAFPYAVGVGCLVGLIPAFFMGRFVWRRYPRAAALSAEKEKPGEPRSES